MVVIITQGYGAGGNIIRQGYEAPDPLTTYTPGCVEVSSFVVTELEAESFVVTELEVEELCCDG